MGWCWERSVSTVILIPRMQAASISDEWRKLFNELNKLGSERWIGEAASDPGVGEFRYKK